MGVREARERMDAARQAYEAAHARVKELEAGGPAYDEAVAAEQAAREAVAEAEATYDELSTQEARLRKRALAYDKRLAPNALWQRAIEGAIDDDVKERLEELRALEEERKWAAIEEADRMR